MAKNDLQELYKRRKIKFYTLSYIVGYILPILYFVIRYGIFETTVASSTSIITAVLITGMIAVLKLAMDIPRWVATWKPSFWKGLIKAIPKLLIFILLMTLGLSLKYIIHRAIDVAFYSYFEAVIVIFGGQSVGSILAAFHLKYKELYLMGEGYVLGVINK